MNVIISNTTDFIRRDKYLIIFFNLNVLFFLFRTSFPFFKYPFVLFYSLFLVYVFITNYTTFFKNLNSFLSNYLIILLLIIFMLVGCINSEKIYLSVIKDLANIFILLSFFYIGTVLFNNVLQIKYLACNLNIQIIFFATFISITLLLNQFNIVSDASAYSSFIPSIYKTNETELIDTNFSLIPIFFALFSLSSLLAKKMSLLKIISSNVVLFVFLIPIGLSGSKRGIIILVSIIIGFIVASFFARLSKDPMLRIFRENTRIIRISLIVLPVLLYAVIETSFKAKSDFLGFIGTKNITAVRYKIASNLFRYVSMLDSKTDLPKFYSRIWNIDINPKNPDSGWGVQAHKTIFPLTGENVEIVPEDVMGYLLDSTTQVVVLYKGNAFSRTLLNKTIVQNNIVKASAYCFVSTDFNGDLVSIEIINRKGTIKSDEYDLMKKNCWQKLEISQECQNDTIEQALWFSKYHAVDFDDLNGYVIFANPEISNSDDTTYIPLTEKDKYEMPGINHNNVFTNNISKASIIGIVLNNLPSNIRTPKDPDPIRRWIAKIVSEDTTYYGYKGNYQTDTKYINFGDDRKLLWKFAAEIFMKEYSWTQKVLGGGYNFLNWYGYYFDRDKTRTDYPHNPFLSILLYSGIIGLIFYFALLIKVIYLYIKYIKEYYYFFIFFLISFFFTFFSGGNPFDPPVMGFLVILPFFIHSVYKKDSTSVIISDTK